MIIKGTKESIWKLLNPETRLNGNILDDQYDLMGYLLINSILRINSNKRIVVVVEVRIDCSGQLSRDEVTSLIYSSPIAVNGLFINQ